MSSEQTNHGNDVYSQEAKFETEMENLTTDSDQMQTKSESFRQVIPVWRAFNSQVTEQSGHRPIDNIHALPIVNNPAHEWSTLVTVLENVYQLNRITCPDNSGPVMVTLDMDLYKRALKLEYLGDQYKGKWWLLPGAFHTSLCAVRCLGKTIEHSGLDEAWVASDLYSRVTVSQIISGGHFNRAVDAHEITLQVLFDLWIESFFKEHPAVKEALTQRLEAMCEAHRVEGVAERKMRIQRAHQELLTDIESLNLEKQLMDFDEANDSYPMYKWLRIYMRQVQALLSFHRSVKDPQFHLYLATMEDLCTYFFAYNRYGYAQNILEFTARSYAAKEDNPDIWRRLVAGEFAVTKNKFPFTSIGTDQAQEQENKILKGEGGLTGITNIQPPYSSTVFLHLNLDVSAKKQKRCLEYRTRHVMNITTSHPPKLLIRRKPSSVL